MTEQEILDRLAEKPGKWHRANAFGSGSEARNIGRTLKRLAREGKVEREFIPPMSCGWAYRIKESR